MEQGIFQKDFAKMLGLDEMTVVNWETEKRVPTKKNMEKLKGIIDMGRGM